MSPTACLIIIGNEILSGRTQDQHLAWIAKELNDLGIRLAEARVIPDKTDVIVETVNACRPNFRYIFTTGGIGPTHDDITADAIARAFGMPLVRNQEAEAILARHYGKEKLTPPRLKMADIPKGATLIGNPVSAAPGFKLENVFVFAGVPGIMRAMFAEVKATLKGGSKMLSRTLSAYVTESTIAEKLSAIQGRYPDVEIGSYPFFRSQRLGTSLVARGTDPARLDKAAADIKALLLALTQEVTEEEAA